MKLKRFLAIVLSLAMVLSTMSFSAVATETTDVAKIGETPYETLSKAIESATDGDKITLLTNASVSSAAIAAGTNITIDLSGKEMTMTPAWGEYAITVNGGLTISGEGDVILKPQMFVGYGIGVKEGGKLTINGGNFSIDGTSGVVASAYGELVVNGGTFKGPTNTSIFNTGDNAKVTITDGTFSHTPVDVREDDTRTISISGGTGYTESFDEAWLADGCELDPETGSVKESVPAISGTFKGGMVNMANPAETYITADISNLYATESVVLKLYDANDTLLATTTLKKSEYFVKDTLSVKFCILDTSSSWETVWETDKLRADYVPAYATLYVDNTEMNSANIRMIRTGDEVAINWADVPGVNPAPVENTVATIGSDEYKTLQAAIDAAYSAGGEVTISLVDDVTENVTIKEKVGFYLTIDGADKTMNGTVVVNALSDTNDNRRTTIQNLNFVDKNDSASVNFIKSNETNHYPRITVTDCSFTGSGYEDGVDEDVAIRLKSAYDAKIENCTGNGLHSFLQNNSGVKFTIRNVTITDSNGGLAMGTAQNVEIRGCDITTNTYGIRLDAVLETSATLNGNTVNAYIPVCVRNATAENYKLAFSGSASSYTATNSDGVWCAICATEYEEGVALNAPTGNVKISWNTDVLDESGVYGAYEWPIEVVFGDGYIKGFDSLSSAMGFGYSSSDEKTIIVHEDITEEMDSLEGNITTDNPNGVTIKNTIVDEWIYCSEDFTIGEGVTYDATGYASGLFMYAKNAVINGTVVTDCYYQRYADTKLTINEPGSMTVKTETFILRYTDGDGEAGIYVVGDNDDSTIGLNAQVIYFYQGMINAKDADIKVGTYWQTNTTDGTGSANLALDNSNMTVTVSEHKMKATGTSTVTLTNGSQLNLAGGYEGVNPSVDETSSITKNGVNVFAATVNGKSYATLSEAMKAATEGCTITLLNDVTISDAWDCRYNGAKFLVPVTIDGNGHTLKLTGAVDDKNWNTVFRFERDATVKNLTIDASEATGIQRGISAKFNITVDNCTFIGNGTSAKRAVIFGENAGTAISDVTATITKSDFTNWSYGVSDNQSGKDAKSVSITGSTFTNASVLVSASETVTFTGNTMTDGYVNISSYTVPTTLSVTATDNTLDATQENEIKAKTINAQGGFITPIAEVQGEYCFTLAKAIEKAADGDTITLLWSEGKAPIVMSSAVYGKTVTITGTATVDWSKGNLFVGRGGAGNGTVIFDNANLTSASDSNGYGIHVSGREKETDNKYDGTLIIKDSTIELDYLINRGAIELDNSTFIVKHGFGIAGRPASETESGAAATATITLNNNSKVIVNNHNGMGLGQASTTPEGYGIMNVNSGSTFQCTQNFLITENGTMNIDNGNLLVSQISRAGTGNVTLTNRGTINVSGTSDIVADVTGAGWVYMNGVTLGADTKLTGAKVRFASGTNNVNGSVIDNGYFQVGIGAYNGVDAKVDTTNGVIVNVKNAKIGSSGSAYAGWVGTGFYDTDAEKTAAMTDAKYVLNIDNSIAEFGYLHISNDGVLNVNGNAAEKAHYNNSDYSFYAGDFILNGTATFDATDVLALYTKVSWDNGTANPGTLNIVNGAYYEAERHNGAVDGTNFIIKKSGVVNVKDAELYIGEYSTIDANAAMNISGKVTALGAITNNGTIDLATKDALLKVDDSVQVYGKFKSIGNVRGTIAKAADSAVFEITGGTYTQDDISDYVADGYKAVYQESTGLYFVYPDFVVEAIANIDTAVAGDKITVEVKVTEGGKYTNADWVLKYDPRYVSYDGTDDKNYKISGMKYDGATDDGNDEFDANTVLGTYTFTVNELTAEAITVFEIVDAHVHNYEMAIEFDGIAASTKEDSVAIKFKTADREIETKTVTYNGMEQRGNEVKDAPANATITYSKTEDFTNGTQLPPAFVNVGTHTYYAQIKLDGYATKVVSGALVIEAKKVEPSVEWMVAPESDRVEFKPVIKGVVDESFKDKGGKVTVTYKEADGTEKTVSFDASEFAYVGHGRAVYTGNATVLSGIKSGVLTVTVKYTEGTNDNYATSEATAEVNVDKSTIDDAMEDKLATFIKGEGDVVYDGVAHFVTVDDAELANLGWTASVATHKGVTYYGDVEVVDVTFKDTTGKYNDYTATVMVKIVRRNTVIYVNNATKQNGQSDSEATGWGYTASPDIIGTDLGEIKIVRAEGHTGEIEGSYTITAAYTPNDNYIVRVEDGTLTIFDAVVKIEVVDNTKNNNKGIDAEADYTVGTRMILVHTDADYAFFTYNGKRMYDVSDAGYAYFEHDYDNNVHQEGKKYKHVYAIVVEAEYGYAATEENEDLYARGVKYEGKDETASYAPIKVTYDADINEKDELHMNDYSTVKGIYNSIYDCEEYQISILKADYNKNKIVNTADAQDVKNIVIK